MGFNHEMLTQTERTGLIISRIIDYFTRHDINSVSLSNIVICLICTGLRTPRTVGDLFGFFFSIGENMNKGSSSSPSSPKVADAIDTESKKIPWNYKGSSSITDAVKALAGKKHNGTSHNSEADLHTLYDSKCTTPQTCGKYLQSLSYSIYSIISPFFAMSYLSRIVYLTDVLKDGLKNLFDEFKKIDCTHCTGKMKCKHNTGEHSKECKCPSIVQCHNVLPLFFKYGFVFYSARSLNGKYKSKNDWLRQCSQFAKQLKNVIDGQPFCDLLSFINKFLLCIRKPFLLYLLTFWLVAILYFSYGLTIPLDLFHIRSYWRGALSHQISVLALLSKKGLSPTKVGYFTP
ncbi:uncharacterized protein BXIN_2214 [Babesia sp. Xinjiang]|uniref:uncharacterized protein n=1 Tax=Babesia sp. Xinjiang TaxID=462227 RepID=UPI000A231558|nr:uncharacterized protein BXIN_2214 [Babesia sp. Xinjiang]ORM39604.1 hypothetical protein BXIN_2214 [Babesia sp. Xinjiang]